MKKIELKNCNLNEIENMFNENESIVLLRNGEPKYVLVEYSPNNLILTDDEKLEIIAKRILTKYKHAFEVLGND